MAADPSLVAGLRKALASTQDPDLAACLRMTVDQEDGDYASYIGSALYERHGGRSGDRRGDDAGNDVVIAALVADLVSLEAAALRSTTGNDRQRIRTRATLQALAALPELAPDRIPDRAADRTPRGSPRGGDLLAEQASAAAGAVSVGVPAEARRLVDITLLPTTRMHDEQMFIRVIQVFEILYTHIGNGLADAMERLDRGDVDGSCAVLIKAAGRIRATRTLFRVLTTMPPEAFSVIRDNTDGRSAIQSTTHRRVELLGAPATTQLPDPPPGQLDPAGPTLQDTFLRRAPELSGAETRRLLAAMTELDAGWTTAKRTHWGITLKIIGTVAGTGGTSGADYLKERAGAPLFPLLHGAT
jgi:tryptophan 2,3-dioxygenase